MQRWKLNDLEYFEAPALSALVFHDYYPEGKQGGIEIIQHGERVATNGDLRLSPGPGQWARLPEVGERTTDAKNGMAQVSLKFADIDLAYTLRVEPAGDALRVVVDLARSLRPEESGRVFFNLELYPSAYFGKTYRMDSSFGIFPRQANGPIVSDSKLARRPAFLATGKKLTIAPEDPERRMTIEVKGDNELVLLDGRNMAANGWFVVGVFLHSGVAEDAAEILINPHTIPGWDRPPMIAISQVGYHPDQEKHAIIEMDTVFGSLKQAHLLRIEPSGEKKIVLDKVPLEWGQFLRYDYAIFDFTEITEPGMYTVEYGDEETPPFKIAPDVYAEGVWQPTLETYFPVQMCHVEVRDKSRVWHGVCHLDDALQAPTDHEHFDGYRQGFETETDFAPGDHIPGLDVGGWHDAGDYDLAAGSQARTTHVLALIRETFNVNTDQTTVKQAERLVELHMPDGIPDIVEQVAHGTLNLLTGYRVAGHSFCGIIANNIRQYAHLGDACTMTDNRIYDPSLDENEHKCDRSGKPDDRWAFTNRDTALEYLVASALAASSRVLSGFDDELATECLETAEQIWEVEHAGEPVTFQAAYVPRGIEVQEIGAAVELFIATGDPKYRDHLIKMLPAIRENVGQVGWMVARILPDINSKAVTDGLREALEGYKAEMKAQLSETPFGVPWEPRIWGIGWQIQGWAVGMYYLVRAFPDLFDRENVLRVVNYVLGCHPYSNVSLVSGVGARSIIPAYGVNRADWSYIPGGMVSGIALIRPDFPEMKDDNPFLWQQTEYVMRGAAEYIFCVLAAESLLSD